MAQKAYSVYGIGNAVMDLEWEVPLSFLSSHSLEKGFMTLTSREQQEQLLQHADIYYRHCGGSAANTLIAMSHLGRKIFFNCNVAADEWGDIYLQNLEQYGVKTPPQNNAVFSLPTATCLVMITPDADRTMQTYLGIASEFDPKNILTDDLSASDYLYIEGYLASSPKGLRTAVKAMEMARAHNVKTVLSLNDPSMAKYFRPQLKEIMGGEKIDLLFCNADEALFFTEQSTLSDALRELSLTTNSMAVTRGAQGAVIREGEQEWSIPAPRVEAVNTNGAGDLFAGSYLHALIQGYPPPEAGSFACLAASRLVTLPGSRLEADELKKLQADFSPST